MNLNMFDTDGMTFLERGNTRSGMSQPPEDKSYNGDMPRFPSSTPLAMAYVPFQQWGETKSPEDALNDGTLFSDLIFPFTEVGR